MLDFLDTYWLNLLPLLVVIMAAGVIYWQKRKVRSDLESRNKALLAARRLNKIILSNLDFNIVAQKIADAIPNELQFGTGVFSIIDNGVIRRVAASQTPQAVQAIKALSVPFNKIEIPIDDPNNLMAKAARDGKPFITNSTYDVMRPVLTQEESYRIQQIMSIKTTLIYPIYVDNNIMGIFIASTSKESSKLSDYDFTMIENFVESAGIALQHALLYKKVQDKTEQLTQINQQVSQMNDKLHELDKLKDDFVSVASHELRTPMTAIRSYAWMALHRSDIPLSQKMEKYLSRVMVSTERLINLVNDMLNISRIESGRVEISPKAFDITELSEEVLTEVSAKALEKKLNLHLLRSKVPEVFADPDKVHQVLLNLLGNALKFTPENGQISLSYLSDGKVVEVSVKDSGVGISKEDQSRLFQKFGRLDNSYVAAATSGGTGLGLFICKSLVEIMKGKIWAESEGLGKGTTFKFTLPAATSEVLSHSEDFTKKVGDGAKYLEPVAI